MPLVVVVDRATASAAEIVAAALGENKRAKIVGTRTFGKATIQAVVPVPGGGAVKLTVAEYLHAQRSQPARPRRAARRDGEDAPARHGGGRGAQNASVSDEEGGPRLVACTVERRGRFLVAQPFFDEGQQLALGRRSGLAVEAGELVVVEHAGGSARVVERLGSPDHVGHVLRALLLERGLAPGWPEAALREARGAAEKREEDGRRDDLLELEAITIDPPTARDFDDAISVEPDGDGIRAWVHIADVASYVKPGGALDDEAGRRTCSVYVPGSVEPMLPLELSAGACSLRPGEVRRVVTVELRIGADGKAGAPHIRRALIRSRARLTYDDAQEILAGRLHHPQGDLLARADALARDLRARRHLGAPSRWPRASSRSRSTTAASWTPAGTRSRARTRSSRSSCCSRTKRWGACSREPAALRSTASTITRSTRHCWRWPTA